MRIYKIIFIILSLTGFLFSNPSKPNILITYHSISGNTKSLAKAVFDGVNSIPGVSVKLLNIKDVQKKHLLSANAIIIGSPVHNANITPEVQRFINSWPFKNQPMKNKIGAAFVTAGGISSGEEHAVMNILQSMLIYNMIIIGGPDWKSAFGASAIIEETPIDKSISNEKVKAYYQKKGKMLGKRVARIVLKLNNQRSHKAK